MWSICSGIENNLITALFKYRYFKVSIRALPYLNHLLRTKGKYLLLKISAFIEISLQKKKLLATHFKIIWEKIKYRMTFCCSLRRNRPQQTEILLQSEFLQRKLISIFVCYTSSHLFPKFKCNFHMHFQYQLHRENTSVHLLQLSQPAA